jgi:hypothetical protein
MTEGIGLVLRVTEWGGYKKIKKSAPQKMVVLHASLSVMGW